MKLILNKQRKMRFSLYNSNDIQVLFQGTLGKLALPFFLKGFKIYQGNQRLTNTPEPPLKRLNFPDF